MDTGICTFALLMGQLIRMKLDRLVECIHMSTLSDLFYINVFLPGRGSIYVHLAPWMKLFSQPRVRSLR